MTRKRKPERCEDWPGCGCGRRWDHWARYLAEVLCDPGLSAEEFDDILFDIVFMLSCVSRYCPDPTLRRHATLQLMRPVFAEEARRWLN